MMEAGSCYRTRAHAKLNLALSVAPPMDSPGSPVHGYHPIRSWMHSIELHDLVEITRREPGEPAQVRVVWLDDDGRQHPVGWNTEQDLAARAHRALEGHTRQRLACTIEIKKKIPAGGGLGGGSSDAGSVLNGLNELFSLGLDRPSLAAIAMSLGSDVGYFLDDRTPPRPAIVSGFGEGIDRQAPVFQGQEITLIVPPFGCDTARVYQEFDRVQGRDQHAMDPGQVDGVVSGGKLDPARMFNDLSDAAISTEPRLGALIRDVERGLGERVMITGSGSTLFMMGHADAGRIIEHAQDCRVIHTRLC